jgi:predicted GIY-YIG superfamily endonuclease
MKNSLWYIYIVQCADGTLYTGSTTDVTRRLEAHNTTPSGAKYTKARRPVTLVYQELVGTRSDALRREYEIKQYTREKKKDLIGQAKNSTFH